MKLVDGGDSSSNAVNASSLHNPTKQGAQTARGELQGGLFLLVLDVDAGSVFHQQLGCFHTVLITRQVADEEISKTVSRSMLFFCSTLE